MPDCTQGIAQEGKLPTEACDATIAANIANTTTKTFIIVRRIDGDVKGIKREVEQVDGNVKGV